MNTQILNLDFYGWGKNGMIENPADVPLEDVFILRQDVLDIIKNLNPHEVSTVKCDLCSHEWVAVRPEGLDELECPNCSNMVNFENIGDTP